MPDMKPYVDAIDTEIKRESSLENQAYSRNFKDQTEFYTQQNDQIKKDYLNQKFNTITGKSPNRKEPSEGF